MHACISRSVGGLLPPKSVETERFWRREREIEIECQEEEVLEEGFWSSWLAILISWDAFDRHFFSLWFGWLDPVLLRGERKTPKRPVSLHHLYKAPSQSREHWLFHLTSKDTHTFALCSRRSLTLVGPSIRGIGKQFWGKLKEKSLNEVPGFSTIIIAWWLKPTCSSRVVLVVLLLILLKRHEDWG